MNIAKHYLKIISKVRTSKFIFWTLVTRNKNLYLATLKNRQNEYCKIFSIHLSWICPMEFAIRLHRHATWK